MQFSRKYLASLFYLRYHRDNGLKLICNFQRRKEDVIYMRMKNDISFLLDYRMNLFEHQSSDNPNMPLRGLLYFARQYEKFIAENEYNLYGSKLVLMPTPQYVVFYNGNNWTGERKILKLSDSFANNNN